MMNIVVESHIPFIQGIFEAAGHSVTYLPPEEITNERILNVDALVIRTRTKCDASLLSGSKVKKIATATIGTDHIDFEFCHAAGIEVFSAPGCNAPGVAQYVLSSVASLCPNQRPVIGIIGVGHVGSIVHKWAECNGFPTLLCDPPLGLPASLAEIAAEAEVITFHTPLDSSTRHIINSEFLSSLRRKPILINAARGPIADTGALLAALESGIIRDVVIDCWEDEPNINRCLLDSSAIATPHIAGYSLQGKRRATAMAVMAIDPSIKIDLDPIADHPTLFEIADSYNPIADTKALKATPDNFEALRNSYTYRSEP